MTVFEHRTVVRQIWPLLAVQDITRSIAFYQDSLGFAVAERAGAARAGSQTGTYWCRLERDGLSIMLQQADEEDGPAEGRGRGVGLYFICDDADAMYAELSARGVAVAAPSVAYYGMKQLFVREPDGYELCFESLVATQGR